MAKRTVENDDFDDILDRSFEELNTEKLLPDGGYILKGLRAAYMAPKGEGNGRVLFFYSVKEPMDNVDEDALMELGEGYDFEQNEVVFQIWVGKGRDWGRVEAHLAKHGVKKDDYKSPREAFKLFEGTLVAAELETDEYENASGETITQNVPSNFSPVE